MRCIDETAGLTTLLFGAFATIMNELDGTTNLVPEPDYGIKVTIAVETA